MKITRRGRIVRAILIVTGVSFAVWFTSTRLWYTDTGWCIGSMSKCIGL